MACSSRKGSWTEPAAKRAVATPWPSVTACSARLSGETIRLVLQRLGIGWKRAKHWLVSPDPEYARKKKLRDRLIEQAAARPDWVLGFQDETWWTRLAQPNVFAWAGAQPLRLLPNERGDGREALAGYGLLRADTGAMLLRFVEGRPVSQVTEDYLSWLCAQFAAEGKNACSCWSGTMPLGTSASGYGAGSGRATGV
jgi:hypothetical protein